MPAAGAVYLLADTGQEALLAARVRLAKFKVEAAEAKFTAGDKEYAAGSWVIADQPGVKQALDAVAGELALKFDGVATAPEVKRHLVDFPRLAVLQLWGDTQAAGWVRMIFDDQKIPYTLIMDEDVKRGGLKARFDVILYPETYRNFKHDGDRHRPEVRAAAVHEDGRVPVAWHADVLT